MVSATRSIIWRTERSRSGVPMVPAEVLLGHDRGGVHRPGRGELDAELLEGRRAVAPVLDDGVTQLPLELVVRVGARGGEVAVEAQPGALAGLLDLQRALLASSATRIASAAVDVVSAMFGAP
jgi:hypothetical protein